MWDKNEKSRIIAAHDSVVMLPKGAKAVCPVCGGGFVKRYAYDKQGLCSKDPCGNIYRKNTRTSTRGNAVVNKLHVGQISWPLAGKG